MKIPFSPPDITEQEADLVREALLSGWITTGPKTKEFERKIADYCGTEKAVCLNSATACMESILRLLGVGPGDEVITSAYTYTATASVTCHVGAKVVLVDTKPGSFEMDYEKMADAITERTKVVIPVDLGGVVCDYDQIFKAVESKRHLFRANNDLQKAYGRVIVLADAAHAFGATWKGKRCGSIADFTSFSFHAVKNLTTAEGGALTWRSLSPGPSPKGEGRSLTPGSLSPDPSPKGEGRPHPQPLPEGEGGNDEAIYKQFQLLSLHGQNKDALAKTQLGAWEYDIIAPYYKCNMTDVMAAIGLVQLERYPQLLARRREIIGRYNEALSGLPVQVLPHYPTADTASSGHLYITRLLNKTMEERNEIIIKMAERDIACNVHYKPNTNVHYKPLPMMTAYKALGFDIKDYPNAFDMFKNEVTLPLHTKLTDEMVEYVISNYVDIVQSV